MLANSIYVYFLHFILLSFIYKSIKLISVFPIYIISYVTDKFTKVTLNSLYVAYIFVLQFLLQLSVTLVKFCWVRRVIERSRKHGSGCQSYIVILSSHWTSVHKQYRYSFAQGNMNTYHFRFL